MKKTPTDEGTAMKYIEYIRKYIYRKICYANIKPRTVLRKLSF